jgi:hypothetical protein
MSILSVPLEALPLMQNGRKFAEQPDDELTHRGLVENDRNAMRLAPPWHAESMRNARTGEVLLTPCDCMLESDHGYAERMAWPAGLMQRER